MKTNYQRLGDLWENIVCINVGLMRVPERKVEKSIYTEAQQTPHKINPKGLMPQNNRRKLTYSFTGEHNMVSS